MADSIDARATTARDFADELLVADRALAADPTSVEAAWRVARAACGLAEASPEVSEQERVARRGVTAASVAARRAPGRVEPHYYAGVAMGLLARASPSEAFALLPRMQTAGEAARAIDERFERGGPLRLLGALYTRAPAWPVSVGDSGKAVEMLERAVAMAPDFPLNRLLLGEAYFADERYADAEREIRGARPALPARWQVEADKYLRRMDGIRASPTP